MSKNNQLEEWKQHGDCHQRFSLRKLSVGVASVLVGLTFAWSGENALASDTQPAATGQGDSTTDVTAGTANQGSQVALHQNSAQQDNQNSSSQSSEANYQASDNQSINNSTTTNSNNAVSANNMVAASDIPAPASIPATYYHTDDWNVAADNTITLKHEPTSGSTVYVPNSFDFEHAVYLTPDYIKHLSQLGVSQLFIDHQGNGTVKAQAGDWSVAFANGKWTKLDLANLDTAEVTNMTGLFEGDTKLISVVNIDKWNTSNVTDMHGMFAGTNSLVADSGTLDLHDWDTSKVIAMNSMFDGSCSLTKIDVHGWNVSNVVGVNGVGNNGMDMMFRCSASIGGSTLAYNASKLQTVDISGWSNPDKLTDVGRMFMFDRNLQEVKGINEWLSHPNNIQLMGEMFRGCTKLQRLDLSKWKVTNLTNMGSAFRECPALQSLGDLSHWDTHNLQSLNSTFNGTTNFNDPVTLNSLSHWNTGNLHDLNEAFMNSGITKLDLSSWHPQLTGTGLVFTFLGCTQLTGLGDLSNWDTSNVTNMGAAFDNTPKLTDQRTANGLASWNVSNNTNFNQVFQNCGLHKLDLHNWNTSKGTGFDRTFYLSGVKDLNISGWDFSHGTFNPYAHARAVNSFVFNLANPALVTMNNVTLPSSENSFKVTDFAGTKPLVVISNKLPLTLNSQKWYFNIRTSTGATTPGPDITGRQNSNILTFVDKQDPSTILGKKPMDFVFASNADFEKSIQAATNKTSVQATIGSENSGQWQSNTDLTDDLTVADPDISGKVLHTDYSNAPASFPELAAATYSLTMQHASVPTTTTVSDEKTVTRTINFDVTGTGHTAITPITQIITYTRTGVKDLATNSVTWGTWIGSTTFPAQVIPQIHGFDSYVNGVETTSVDTTPVTFNNGNPQNGQTVTVIYKKQRMIPVPYDPAKDNMEMTVTRTIKYDVAGTSHATICPVTQNVVYTREDAQGNAGYQDPVTGVISWNAWHAKDNGQAQFPAANVTQIAGFDSYVDVQKSTQVAAADVAEIDGIPQNGKTVTVTYVEQNHGNNGGNTNPVTPNHSGNNGGNTNLETPNNISNGNTVIPQTNVIANSDHHINVKNDNQRPQKLPQTGNNSSSATLAGLGLAGLTTMFGLAKMKKQD